MTGTGEVTELRFGLQGPGPSSGCDLPAARIANIDTLTLKASLARR